MRTVAVASQKCGVGKSTITVHLAVAAIRAGQRVLVLDADPQGSATAWREERTEPEPPVEAIDASDVAARVKRAQREKVDLVVIDTAPRAGASLATILRLCDLVLVPFRPSAFDIATTEQSVQLVVAAKVPGAIIISSAPPRAPEIAEAQEMLADAGLPLCPVVIVERRVYARAVARAAGPSTNSSRAMAPTMVRRRPKYATSIRT